MSRIPNTVSGDSFTLQAAVQRVTSPTLEFSVPSTTAASPIADRYTLPAAATLGELREFTATMARALINKGVITGRITS